MTAPGLNKTEGSLKLKPLYIVTWLYQLWLMLYSYG